MSEGSKDRQGAVPGITVHEHGSISIVGEHAIDFLRLCSLRGAVSLEVKTGMKLSRGRSALTIAKREMGLSMRTPGAVVLAKLEARIEAERLAQNLPRN